MSFPKLSKHLQDCLKRLEFENPLEFQQHSLSQIKSGADFFCLAPAGSGKTTALMISVIQQLKDEAVGDNPRALIFVKDKAEALKLEEAFVPFTRFTDLRVFSAYDQHDPQGQKDQIYDGVDILIGTPGRLLKLMLMNGFNLAELKLMAIEDAEFLTAVNWHSDIIRIAESAGRFQSLVFAEKMVPRFDRLKETFMSRAKVIAIS